MEMGGFPQLAGQPRPLVSSKVSARVVRSLSVEKDS